MQRQAEGHPLTAEQNRAVELALTRPDVLRIEAFAGAGKTSTLAAIATALAIETDQCYSGIYLAFNKAIATDAKGKFPPTVEARTVHSLAYQAIAPRMDLRTKLAGRLNGRRVADILQLGGWGPFSREGVGSRVLDTVERFCNSADDEIASHHVPGRIADHLAVAAKTNHPVETDMLRQMAGRGISVKSGQIAGPVTDADRAWLKANRDAVDAITNPERAARTAREHIAGLAAQLFDRMVRDPRMLITHSVYLKLWALSRPVLDAEFILFDEAQDANPVMLSLLAHQRAPVIYVGDRYQEIYGWRGAVNALEQVGGKSCRISQSFRFGQPIADLANLILNRDLDADVQIEGFDAIRSRVVTDGTGSSPDAILGRSNAAVLNELLLLAEGGRKVHLVGGSSQFLWLVESLDQLLHGRPASHPDIADFGTWEELRDFTETESGRDLAAVVNAVENHGAERLLRALKTCPENERAADVTLSTAHKAKGRQWPRVRLLGDFRIREDEDPDRKSSLPWSPEESRILYVAATRGQLEMDITACRGLAHLFPAYRYQSVA
jgi:superfamily I DNA/RNA helicase